MKIIDLKKITTTLFCFCVLICSAQTNWSVEDLHVTTFRNGDPLMEANSETNWKAFNANQLPAYYRLGPTDADGILYNYYALIDERQLAPEGYRIAGIEDIKALDVSQYFQSSEGGWKTNTSTGFFNANAFGYISDEAYEVFSAGDAGYYWTNTLGAALKSMAFVFLNGEKGYSIMELKRESFCAVRCVKNDAEEEAFNLNEKALKEEIIKRKEVKLIAEQKAIKEAEEKRLSEEKAKNEAEAKRLAEEKAKKDQEAKRLAEEKAKKDAEAKRLAEEKAKREAEERARKENESKNNNILGQSSNNSNNNSSGNSKSRSRRGFGGFAGNDLNSSFSYLSIQLITPNSKFSSLPVSDEIINSQYYNDAFYSSGRMGGGSGFGMELGGLIQLEAVNENMPSFMEFGIPIDGNYSWLETDMASAASTMDPNSGFTTYLQSMSEEGYSIWGLRSGISTSIHAFPNNDNYPFILDLYFKLGYSHISHSTVSTSYQFYYQNDLYTDDVSIIQGSRGKFSGQLGARLRLFNLLFIEANSNFGLGHSGNVKELHSLSSNAGSDLIEYNYSSDVSLNHNSISIGINLLLLFALF
jgi:hypothetical protein